ncbi:hypothetical protein ABBQ32_011853 [Trebouxia sp. C0010 RCD-2024]
MRDSLCSALVSAPDVRGQQKYAHPHNYTLLEFKRQLPTSPVVAAATPSPSPAATPQPGPAPTPTPNPAPTPAPANVAPVVLPASFNTSAPVISPAPLPPTPTGTAPGLPLPAAAATPTATEGMLMCFTPAPPELQASHALRFVIGKELRVALQTGC